MNEQQNDNVEETRDLGETAATEAQNEAVETESDSGSESFVADDALLERAVKAGISLADAKSFGSKEMAERIIGQLEGRGGNVGGGASSEKGGEDFPAIDFGDFTVENGYEPNLVRNLNTLKSVIEAQAKVIKELKAGSTAKSKEKAVETRKNLLLARPGGEKGRVNSGSDPEADALAALRRRFKLN